eukprot:Sspe_Gene.58993::Locus_32400_Transcript_1_1_Confidence_1.000_Length_1072::g.58993::m.58993/K02088/CDK3; cyclin-dependent kinase 3
MAVYSPHLVPMVYDDLVLHEKLGEGSYGTVHKARHKATGELLAVKKQMTEWYDYDLPPSSLREVASLVQVPPHPFLVNLRGFLHPSPSEIMLVFEFIAGGDLDARLDEYVGRYQGSNGLNSPGSSSSEGKMMLPLSTTRRITWQLVSAVVHLHTHGMIHRDIKPANILVSHDLSVAKLSDLGMARHMEYDDRCISREAMTVNYRPPEVILSGMYNSSCDIWSVGAVLAELLCHGAVLFEGDKEINCLFQMFEILGTPTEATWPSCCSYPEWNNEFPQMRGKGLRSCPWLDKADPEAVDLLQRMLTMHPAGRVTAADALQHPFFARL